MRYCPASSVSAVRTFSMRAGLEASTVTPGSTPPDSSLTVPVRVPCAQTSDGKRVTATRNKTGIDALRMVSPFELPSEFPDDAWSCFDVQLARIQRLLSAF